MERARTEVTLTEWLTCFSTKPCGRSGLTTLTPLVRQLQDEDSHIEETAPALDLHLVPYSPNLPFSPGPFSPTPDDIQPSIEESTAKTAVLTLVQDLMMLANLENAATLNHCLQGHGGCSQRDQ